MPAEGLQGNGCGRQNLLGDSQGRSIRQHEHGRLQTQNGSAYGITERLLIHGR